MRFPIDDVYFSNLRFGLGKDRGFELKFDRPSIGGQLERRSAQAIMGTTSTSLNKID